MKRMIYLSGLLLCWALPALAADKLQLAHVGQGILPNGGYYNVYTFRCGGEVEHTAVRLQQGKWCASLQGGVLCRRKPTSIAAYACGELPAAQWAVR